VSGFLRVVWLVLKKDLTVEVRSLEIVSTTLFFAVSCVLFFSVAFVEEGTALRGAAPGILWVAVAFSGTLALGRTFERERQAETLRALLLAPADRPAIYVGKLLGILALLVAAELMLLPLIAYLFQASFFAHPLWLMAVLGAGTLGYCTVGTLFAAMLVRARSRDVLLPILLYPITIPVIIAGVRATATLLDPDFDAELVRFWVSLMVAYDTVFLTLALWAFEPLMTD
jgi:heme exporter protein B